MTARLGISGIDIADSAAPPLAQTAPGAALANAVIDLARELGGLRIVAAVATIGGAVPTLTPGEKKQFQVLGSKRRRECWLAGRAAIKAVRERLGLDIDTAGLRFPDSSTSLTHAGEYAVAIGVPRGALRGLGIDLETWRHTDAGITRFFLTSAERDWIERLPPTRQGIDRVRLWTVKEAVFKARPDNQGMILNQFALDDPSTNCGRATVATPATGRKRDMNRVSYASKWTPAGCVSLACSTIRQSRPHDAAAFRMGRMT